MEKPFTWPRRHTGTAATTATGTLPTDIRAMEEVMEIMRDALVPPSPAAGPATAATARLPARLSFRELLLGVTLPDEFR